MSDKTLKFNKLSLLGWCLFDFANAVPAVIGGIYFSKWFVEDIGGGTILFNTLFFVSTLILLLTGKIVGRAIDNYGYRFWIKLASLLSFAAVLLLYFNTYLRNTPVVVVFSFLLFLIYLFGYQVSRICHNSYLHKAIPESQQSKMSGYGAAANWAGSIIGILLTIPIINAQPGVGGRETTFLVAALVYGVFVSISIVLMFLTSQMENDMQPYNYKKGGFINLFRTIGFMLLVYIFLFDVMTTVQRNLPPYLSEVIRMSDNKQSLGFLVILIAATVGGFISSRYINKTNSAFWLKLSSFFLAIAILAVLVDNKISLWCAFAVAGVCYGILESAIRLNFMSTFTAERAGENFGMLAIVERTSGLCGPVIWVVPFLFFHKAEAYILSFALLSGLTLTAFLFIVFKYDRFSLNRK